VCRYKERRGIDIGSTDILVYALVLQGKRCVFSHYSTFLMGIWKRYYVL